MGLVRLLGPLATVVLTAACASSGAVPRPFPGSGGAPAPPAAAGAAVAGSAALDPVKLVETALRFRGVPYRNGGADPNGFDCSGLVQYVFAQHGVKVPREVRDQLQLGREVRLAGIERGDLIFFATDAKQASHVGVAVGGDEFVHAPSSRGVVRVERFSAPYWARRIVGIRRLH